MSQVKNLLLKGRNRFLAYAPPENLVPAAPLGKKTRRLRRLDDKSKKQTTYIQYFKLKHLICDQWTHSWNQLKKRQKLTAIYERCNGKKSRKNVNFQKLNFSFTILPKIFRATPVTQTKSAPLFLPECAPKKECIEPENFIYKIKKFMGGNFTQHLESTTNPFYSTNGANSQSTEKKELLFEFQKQDDSNVFLKNGLLSRKRPLGSNHKRVKSVSFFLQLGLNNMVHFVNKRVRLDSTNVSTLFSLEQLNTLYRTRNRINDQFRNQYAECKKISILYGNIPRRALVRTMHNALESHTGNVEFQFLSLLERRLDVTLKRILFFPTIYSARQWICQGKITVNSRICLISSYLLQPADVITIVKQTQNSWKKEWQRHFNKVTISYDSPFLEAINKKSLFSRVDSYGEHINVIVQEKATKKLKEAQSFPMKKIICQRGEKKNAHFTPALLGGRRFLFSPHLMQMWKKWGDLWGNFVPFSPKIVLGSASVTSFAKQNGGYEAKHKWAKKSYSVECGESPLFISGNSVLSQYLKQTDYKKAVQLNTSKIVSSTNVQASSFRGKVSEMPFLALLANAITAKIQDAYWVNRRETKITAWFQLANTYLKRKTGLNSKLFSFTEKMHQAHTKLLQKTQFQEKRVKAFQQISGTSNKVTFKTLLPALLLVQHQINVVDGLYVHRCNKAFMVKKLKAQKKYNWQYSCIKPLHIECSYKKQNAIFLYNPQKLVWPSSINISLLQKALLR